MKNNVFLCRLVIRLHPSIFVDHDIDCGVPTGDSFFGDEQGFFPKKLFMHLMPMQMPIYTFLAAKVAL